MEWQWKHYIKLIIKNCLTRVKETVYFQNRSYYLFNTWSLTIHKCWTLKQISGLSGFLNSYRRIKVIVRYEYSYISYYHIIEALSIVTRDFTLELSDRLQRAQNYCILFIFSQTWRARVTYFKVEVLKSSVSHSHYFAL